MRVIAGRNRGRRLGARPPEGVRPTSDRVREAIFDMLWSMDAVEGATVVDLFCGTGALGLEALSRGAACVTFVDHDRAALEAVAVNQRSAGLEGASARLVRGVLPGWLAGQAPVDLALCDPPYAYDAWPELLAGLRAAVAVLESDREIAVPPGWMTVKARTYGGTLVTVARHEPFPPPTAAGPAAP